MGELWKVLVLTVGLAVAGCGGDDDDDDATGDGDADSDSDSDSDSDGDGDGDGDGDADIEAECDAACDHIETCNFPEFNHVGCVANCQCNAQGVVQPELIAPIVACGTTVECVDDWAVVCVEQTDFEPTAGAATFVADCTARVQEVCPDEAADYDCTVFGPITDEAAAAFDPCLDEATCADALDCVTTAALGICTG